MHKTIGSERARAASLLEVSLVLVGALAVASCDVQPTPTPSNSSDSAAAAEQPAAAPGVPPAPAAPRRNSGPNTDPNPLPELAFAVNGGQTAIAYQGRPLILEVALFHPQDA
jgi:hypothetical protein